MGNRLYIGNLAYTLTQDDLKNAFSTSGSVTFVRIMTDRETGQSRGFGFVQFATDSEALQAVADWDGKELGGRRLVVNEARDKNEAGPSRSFVPTRSASSTPVEVYNRNAGPAPDARPASGGPGRPKRSGGRERRNSRDFGYGYDD